MVVENCYSSGLINTYGKGLYHQVHDTTSNCYVANNSWSFNDAKAALSGTPSIITDGLKIKIRQGLVWKLVDGRLPFVLVDI